MNKPAPAQTAQAPKKAKVPQRLRSGRNIVPRENVAGNALVFVIAIMGFLACLTLGIVSMVRDTANAWQNDISREVTIQLRPVENISMDESIRQASRIALSFEGVDKATALDDAATSRLLEPWLGSGLKLDELPVPRLITVSIEDGARPDFVALRNRLENEVPGASLDDHRAWVDRLTTMAYTMVSIGVAIFILMMIATILTVVFATRGAMAGNRDVVDVLHFVGADAKFISRQFQRHFLILGMKGGAFGALAAILLFVALGFWTSSRLATPDGDQISALFGTFSLGWQGYLGMFLVMIIIGALTAATSTITVHRQVNHLQDYRRDRR